MTRLISIALFLVTTLFSLTALGQNMMVSGTVHDTSGVRPLPQALVMAIRVKDSLLLGYTRTNSEGKFVLNTFKIDTFALIVTSKGFDDKTYYIFGHDENKVIAIPSVKMPSKSQDLDEVIIYANKNPIYYKGDTLVYVADSFKVGEHAVVEDLLKKLPGLKVDKDGKITSQGKEINQVLVDGDEFFGSDPTIATKNLGANGVKTVEVYEKQDESSGASSDDKIQVLDLRLKEDAKKGYFGRISGASDFALTNLSDKSLNAPTFFETELLLNKFSGSQKISIFALSSNTPRSGFGGGDMYKFGLENEGGGRRNMDGFSVNSGREPVGVPKTLKAGVYYSDKFGKKKNTKLGFNYSYYNTELNSYSSSRSQYFLQDTTYFTNDSTNNRTTNETHNINFNIESKLDSLTNLTIIPRLTLNGAKQTNTDLTDFRSVDEKLTRNTAIENETTSNGYSFNNEVRLNRKFMKPRRELELRYFLTATDDKSDGSLSFLNTYFDNSASNDTTDQSKLNEQSGQTHIGIVTYTEPLTKKIKLETEYTYESGFSTLNKETRNKIGTVYSELVDSLYSNNFDNMRQQNKAGVKLIYESRKHTLSGGAAVRNIVIENQNRVLDTTIFQNVTNVLPNFAYTYKPSQASRFVFRYNTRSDQPAISDLTPVQDNTNPNQIRIGNPNLLPNYVHSTSMFFNTWKALTGRYIWSGMNASLTDRAFSNSIEFSPSGRTEMKTINVDGNYSVILFAGGGLPFFQKKITFSPRVNASAFRNTNFINGQQNVTLTQSLSGALELEFDLDSLEFSVKGDYSYNNPQSSISSVSSMPYSSQEYYGGIQWTLNHGIKIGTEGTYTINSNRAQGFGVNYFIWNAEISKNFLKTGNLNLALRGNDILNQNISAQRDVSGNIITDYKTKIISRYFLVKLTYRFNNNKTKEEDFNGWY
jgi:hypothetical protein